MNILSEALEYPYKADTRPGVGCYTCTHLERWNEGWEHPDIFWYECNARPANAMLKGFPWARTKCKRHKPREQ